MQENPHCHACGPEVVPQLLCWTSEADRGLLASTRNPLSSSPTSPSRRHASSDRPEQCRHTQRQRPCILCIEASDRRTRETMSERFRNYLISGVSYLASASTTPLASGRDYLTLALVTDSWLGLCKTRLVIGQRSHFIHD
jgi:hypothetical protein